MTLIPIKRGTKAFNNVTVRNRLIGKFPATRLILES